MRGFTLQRFLPGGELQLTLVGRQLHHYPIDDRIEIEELELSVENPAGPATRATARRALSNGKATEVQLLGGARVRGTLADGQPIEIDSEFLHYFSLSQRVVTDKPVEVRVGASVVRAGGLVWDNEARVLQLSPPVRAVLQTGRSVRP
jgi:lipopolysaccharide export system protein LptC